MALDELDRVEAIRHDGELLELALRTGVAVNAPNELERTRRDIDQRRHLVTSTTIPDGEPEQVMRTMQKLARVARRQRRAQHG